MKLTATYINLINAAIQVFTINPNGSLSSVAKAAGVQRVTLHRLFGTRDELMTAIAIHSLNEMDRVTEKAVLGKETAIDMLHAIVEALVPVGDHCSFLWSQFDVWEEPRVAREIEAQNIELNALIDTAKAEGSVGFDIPNAWVIAFLEVVIFTALRAARSGDIAVNDAGKLAARSFLTGIASQTTTG